MLKWDTAANTAPNVPNPAAAKLLRVMSTRVAPQCYESIEKCYEP